jgi:hypothetical protein
MRLRMHLSIKARMFWFSLLAVAGLAACGGSDDGGTAARPVLPATAGSGVNLPNAMLSGVAGSTAVTNVTSSQPPAPASPSAPVQAAAGSGAAAPQTAPAPMGAASAGAITYQKDIRPVVEARCVGCHTQGGSGPFALTSWSDVDQYKSLMVTAVQSRHMPPWLADSTNCTKLRYDQRLTDAQLASFMGWQAAGFPQGNEADFKPLVELKQPDIGQPTLLAKSTVPYQLKANTEEYVCLQLDAQFPTDTYIIGMDLAPEHPQFVHHAIVSAGTGECDALGVTAPNIFSYRPGSRTLQFEKGDGLLVPAGTRLAIQYHYNTVGKTSELPTDQSTFRMWTMPAAQKPERIITRFPHHSFAISIAVGAVDQKVSDTAPMGTASVPPGAEGFVPGEIIGVSPHMHVLGQQFKETLVGAGGKSTCLVNVPDWDFNWQIDYFFEPDAVIPITSADSLTQDCVYSNRPEDQLVENGVRDAPKFTTFGENTRDEMCLGYVWFRYKASDIH